MAARRKSGRSRDGESPARQAGLRPFWSGTVTFGLVTVPVDLVPAIRFSDGVALRMLAPDGTPLQRRYHCEEHGRDVEPDELVRGYEDDDGEMVPLSDAELEAVAPRKSRDIELQRFVPVDSIDPLWFDRAWVLTPASGSTKAYRLLADVMERDGRAAIATFVLRDKEHLVAILARNGVLTAETLRFHDEVRTPEDVGADDAGLDAAPDRGLVARFRRAIEKATGDVDLDAIEDPRSAALRALVAEKQARGEDVVVVEGSGDAEADADEGGRDTVDLLERIRQSLRAAGDGSPRPGRAPRRNAAAGNGLAELSKQELYERAKALDVEGRSRMSKQELVTAIADREGRD